MSTKLTTLPKAVITGDHQLIAPLPVDSLSYRAPLVLDSSVGGYQGRDGLAAALATSALTVPAATDTAGFIGTIAADDLPWDDTPRTTHNIPYPTVPAQFGGAIAPEDLIVIDCVTMDLTAAVTPNTPAGYGTRGSYHNGVAWVPKVTRFFKMAVGGETGTLAITTSSSVRMYAYIRIIRGVDPTSYFDIGSPALAYGSGSQSPDPAATSAVATAGSLMEVVVHGNVYPTGNPEYEPSDFSAGFTPVFDNTHLARWSAAGEKVMPTVGGTDNPAPLGIVCDNFTAVSDIYRVKKQTSATLVLVVASDDETPSTSIGTAPVIPARNEVQTIISNLTSGTFTITFSGQTTAAIAFNASAATIKTALENLSNIGAGDINATGGPLGTNQVVIEFVNAMAGADQPAMTTSTGSVTIRQDQAGAPSITFNNSGNSNVPVTAPVDDWVPQIWYWTVSPIGTWPAGRPVNITVSDHANNHSWVAALLVVRGLYTGGPTQTYGSGVSDNAEIVGIFGTVTPATPGSLVLASFAKALNYAGWHPLGGPVPDISHPARYEQVAHAESDAMTLDLFVSSPAASSPERLSSVTWSGPENYADHLVSLRPLVTAGVTASEDVLASQTSLSWLELANSVSELYEVFELDLSSIPTGAALTSASIHFAHSSDVLNPLRVTLVGIKADGTFVTALERRPGGYSTQNVDTLEEVSTGEWFEFSDGSVISDYTRLGALIFSTSRPPGLTTHKLYWLQAEVTYEAGGPVVANVQGPNAPGDSVTWDYSSAAGLPQSHSRVLIVQGADWDLDVQFADLFFTDFPTTGSATTVLADTTTYELYDGVGNAGFGRRRPSAISVVTDVTASANTALRITASNGTGGDTGQLVSGGLKIKRPITYGQIEFRAKASGDANNFLSPVVLLWPSADATRFPAADGGEWPAGGEINIWENFANRDDLNPVEAHLHRLKPGAVPVYDSTDDEFLDFTFPAVTGTAWHKYVLNWLPSGIYLSIDNGAFVTLTDDPDWVPDWPMELCIQFDAWSNGTLGANRTMDVDYVVVRKLATETYPTNPLDPQFGEIVYDSGKVPGATARSLTITDAPLSRGDCTALVRSWARLPNGVEVVSRWGIDEVFNTSGSPATAPAQPFTRWAVQDGKIYRPGGREFTTTGLNGPVGVKTGSAFGNAAGFIAWAYEAYPPYKLYSDVWGGDTPRILGSPVYPAGTISPGVYWNHAAIDDPSGNPFGSTLWPELPSRKYALSGVRSDAAVAAGIPEPQGTWGGIYRVNSHLKNGPYTWAGAPTLTSAVTVPEYVARVRELVDEPGDVIFAVECHDYTAQVAVADFSVSGTLLAAPSTSTASLTGAEKDVCLLLDALVAEFDGSEPVWIGLPNEFNKDGRNTSYDDVVVTLVRRIRAAGWTGIITIPLPRWAGDLASLARGDMETLVDRLATHGVDWGLVWEVHFYGDHYNVGVGSSSKIPYTYDAALQQFETCRDGVPGTGRKHAVWVAEVGQSILLANRSSLPNAAAAVQIMLYDSPEGQALAVRCPWLNTCAWSTGDNSFNSDLSLTKGGLNKLAPETVNAFVDTPGSGHMPWWRINSDAMAEEWCSEFGLGMWRTAQRVAALPVQSAVGLVFNPATAAVELLLNTPAGVSRAWAVRSIDGGATWTLVGPWDVGAGITVKVIDYGVPLSQQVRYEVSFDAGPMTETSAPVPVGAGDVSTAVTAWWLRVPSAPTMSTPITVIETQDTRGFNAVVAEDVEHAVVVGSPPLSRVMRLTVRVHSKAERLRVDAILDSGLTFEVVNILGRSWTVRLAGDVTEQLLRWAPLDSEVTSLRDAHELTFTVVEVKA